MSARDSHLYSAKLSEQAERQVPAAQCVVDSHLFHIEEGSGSISSAVVERAIGAREQTTAAG